MSGPLSTDDIPADEELPSPLERRTLDRLEGRLADVGGLQVHRLLPKRARRTVGAWCFVDQFGPTAADDTRGIEIGPHPHIGLQTVSWLVEGQALHRDSVGSEQVLLPGQLNLMTAGHGVSHSEENPSRRTGVTLGAQLWVAQPERTRHGPPAFEHHGQLPELGLGAARVTVLVGSVGADTSPARTDTPLVGVAVTAQRRGDTTIPLEPGHEHAVVVLDGAVSIGAEVFRPGELAYLGLGRDDVTLSLAHGTHALVLGGEPFESELVMWWNFVARTRDEARQAAADWNAADDRFGAVASPLARIPSPDFT